MRKKPLVSVLMPNYNGEKYLPEAIESILNQTYSNFEFIIIDDCSTDDSWEIISTYAKKDKRVKAYRNEENLKIVKTRNKAFSLASKDSKYYAIFDSDDISMPTRLEEEVNFLEKNKEYGMVGSNIILINEESKIIGKRKYETSYTKIKKKILQASPVAQPSVMIRKKIIDEIGTYSGDQKFDRARDFDLWVRIFDKYKIKNVNKYLLKYRISTTQGKKTHLKETIKSTIQIQKKWMMKKKYFKVKTVIKIILEKGLLLLPEKTVLWLFKKWSYKK